MTAAPLFRKEAMAAQQEQSHGAALLARLPSYWLVTSIVVGFILVLLGYIVFGEYTRKEHVAGYLTPSKGVIKIYTPQAGTIIEKHIDEGQIVKKGDILLTISSDRSTTNNPAAQTAMAQQLVQRRERLQAEQEKQNQIDRLTRSGLDDRIRGLAHELQQTRIQLNLQQQRLDSAKQALIRQQEMAKDNFSDINTIQTKQDDVLEQQSRLAQFERNIINLSRDIEGARVDKQASELKQLNNDSVFERQISEINQQLMEMETRHSVVIVAPTDGVVTTIIAEIGQTAQMSTPLLSILPAGTILEAQLLVPTRAAGFIKPRQEVALRYQAFPYQRFGHYLGFVTDVSRTVITPNETTLPITITEPVYRVTVRLSEQQVSAYGQALSLQAGMILDADVRIDRRRLIEWIFDPVFAITGRV